MATAEIRVEDRAAAFNLAWKVARDEGLLTREGLTVKFVPEGSTDITTEVDHRKVGSFQQHVVFEEGAVDLFNACEWGQVKRAQDSEAGGMIVSKRPAVAVMGLYATAESGRLVPQDLRNVPIAVKFHTGSHYAALQMLEGFMDRSEISVLQVGSPQSRYEALAGGQVEVAALMEPWSTLAEVNGFNRVTEAFYYGTDIGSDAMDAELYASLSRAIVEAVRRINADKRKYLHYFIEEVPERLGVLKPEDFTLSRLRFIEPTPYSKKEFDKTYDWMVSWGLVDKDTPFEKLVDNRITVG
jgi:NitT/TauT family transport system substrate-binding protein